MQYLVIASEGPGFTSHEEAVAILETTILPSFDAMMKLESEGRIVAGGIPVGERTFACIIEAASGDELDRLLRSIPAWGVFSWQVTPLQSIKGRADLEREIVSQLKKG